ncbi:uncharacterized protein L969DRAFT_95556 [Mixia osmundae IAM 14324]|uniref:Uncharacterized protein n=1 Tax=Mixia osmundae (strain CBS 9802 / IAM 14324 / JCM 22182 / KY 12970) TaxID=764103 RepID=G7E7R8_MIXOS|nr:uncharacterized protein L969DRAFT_95556 [Mixia osmundae IAM 14324]KEI38478.1 hypothetical protein L969DRAFT_95556 [Mixia osmundae IAM 14324]GAA98878.1 hypothetical protein E5Q_05566 [Mixia osmundae IAM 14324]
MFAKPELTMLCLFGLLFAFCTAIPTNVVKETSLEKRFSGWHHIVFSIDGFGVAAEWDLAAYDPVKSTFGLAKLDMTIGIAYNDSGDYPSPNAFNVWEKSTYDYEGSGNTTFSATGGDCSMTVDGVNVYWWWMAWLSSNDIDVQDLIQFNTFLATMLTLVSSFPGTSEALDNVMSGLVGLVALVNSVVVPLYARRLRKSRKQRLLDLWHHSSSEQQPATVPPSLGSDIWLNAALLTKWLIAIAVLVISLCICALQIENAGHKRMLSVLKFSVLFLATINGYAMTWLVKRLSTRLSHSWL